MKRIFYLITILLITIPQLFLFSDDNNWITTEFGSFKIERFWEETLGDYNCTYTLVTYRNTTNKTYNKYVTIRATIYDFNNGMINTNTRSFYVNEYGPIKTEFEGILKIPVECEKGQANSVSVRIDKAR